jgi:hypothetical protein
LNGFLLVFVRELLEELFEYTPFLFDKSLQRPVGGNVTANVLYPVGW